MYQNDPCECKSAIEPAGPTLEYMVEEIGEAVEAASKAVTSIDLKLYGPKTANELQGTPPIKCMEDALKDIMNSVINLKHRLNEIDNRL